jgi:hypothetical protein
MIKLSTNKTERLVTLSFFLSKKKRVTYGSLWSMYRRTFRGITDHAVHKKLSRDLGFFDGSKHYKLKEETGATKADNRYTLVPNKK